MSITKKQAPNIARNKPYYFKPVAGKTYLWCSCGRSASQPFCDGSHKGTNYEPVRYEATEQDNEVLFCGCKHTNAAPFCDGAHNNLSETYSGEDPDSIENRCVTSQNYSHEGRHCLNGNTFVAKVGSLRQHTEGNVRWSAVTTAAQGARHQSMFYSVISEGLSPVFAFGDSHVVLLARKGHGDLIIGERTFAFTNNAGMYVGPHETFRIRNPRSEPITMYAAVSPHVDRPSFSESMSHWFDENRPKRIVTIDKSKAQRMGDRTFQLLVGEAVGSDLVTQFVGTIPKSMAARHRHLYEETLIILEGHGAMWTEDLKAPVGPGDAIFLPSKQIHSLQCTDDAGMVVAGVIHPAGNPSINF